MSSITVTEILAEFGFKTDEKQAKVWGKSIDNLKDKMGGALKMSAKLAAGLGTLATGLLAITKAAANSGDEAIKGARRVGMKTEAYQEMTFAAKQSGLAAEEFTALVTKQNQVMGKAAQGDKTATDALKRLGLTYTQIKDMKPEDQMGVLADRIVAIKDPARRAAAAAEVFGRSWSKAATLLEGGSAGIQALREQAREMGHVIGEDAAKGAEQFNDSIARMQLRIMGLRNRIGFALMPVFQKAITGIEKWWSANRELIEQKMDEWAQKLGRGLEKVGDFLEGLPAKLEKFGGLTEILKGALKLMGIIAAVKVALPFIQLAKALGPIIVAIKAAGIVGAIAAAKVILAIAAVVAILASVYLIIDDIFAFLQGRDSVIGRIVDAFKEWIEKAREAKGMIGSLVRAVEAFANFVVAASNLLWSKIGPVINDLKQSMLSVLDLVSGRLSEFWTGDVKPILDTLFSFFSGLVGGALDDITAMLDLLTLVFTTGATGAENFDAIVGNVMKRIQARIRETVGEFGIIGDAIKKIPGIGRLLGPSTEANTRSLAPSVQPASQGAVQQNINVQGGATTYQINGTGDPSTTAAVIDRKQSNREANTYRQARAAFAGGER